MNAMAIVKSVKATAKVGLKMGKDKAPVILTGMAIVGVVATVAATFKAQKRAEEVVDRMTEQNGGERPDSLDILKKVAPVYAPVVVTSGLTIAAIVGAQTINMRRQAALAALLSLSEETLRDYKEKAKEVVGEEKAKDIDEKVIEDRARQTTDLNVTYTGDGGDLWFEPISGRWLMTSFHKIKEAMMHFNSTLVYDNALSLNEWFTELGLPETVMGDSLGWKSDKPLQVHLEGGENDHYHLRSDGKPYGIILYSVEPTASYRDW